MSISVRVKLMASYLLLMFLMGLALFFYLNHTLDSYFAAQFRDNLTNEALLAAHLAENDSVTAGHDWPKLSNEIGNRLKARVTFIGKSGEVTGDSEINRDKLSGMDNHLSRPEVQEALYKGVGSSVRYSSTLRTDMLYVAVPFSAAVGEVSVIRLAVPLTAVTAAKQNLHTVLGIAFVFAVGLSLILSYILSQLTYRPLQEIAAIAVRIGEGDFSRRLPEQRRDELGKLARVMNDMSDRIQNQLERLETEKNRLDVILHGMGEGLMVVDPKGVITLINPAFRRFFALDEEVVGRQIIDISRHPVLSDSFAIVTQTRNDYSEEISLHFPEEKTLLIHWAPLLEDSFLRGVVAVFHDITDLKRLEKIRRDFVANVSHELRTPVSVIKGYAETLLGGVISEDPQQTVRFVEIIYSHSERLANLIGDLLSLSELESRKVTLELLPCSVETIARRAALFLEPKAAQKGITLHYPEPNGQPKALADQGRLEQVFINLLDNAIKYTPNGGKAVVTTEESSDTISISVTDDGPGIPPDDLPRIFERFYRVDAGRSRKEGGTGLGLSIVKHIVQLHGGTISVKSTLGSGTAFTFTLKKA